jgi:four helix bundle protein
MQNPRNLRVSVEARAAAVAVYRFTAAFPREERFGMTQQLRRAAVSIGSNIWEGCGRCSRRELLQYLHLAYGSANEVAFQVSLAGDLDFGDREERIALEARLDRLQRMLNRLIASKRTRRDPPEGD